MVNFYTIRALTDMHVGSGDANYNIVENQVQRDVVTGFPTINASSLKGALRSHFNDEKYCDKVFGTSDATGVYKFFNAKLLSYPVRSNVKPFFRATCPGIIKELAEWLKIFNYDLKGLPNNFLETAYEKFSTIDSPIVFENLEAIIEDYIIKPKSEFINYEYIEELEALFGENLVIFPDCEFKEIVNELPVIARNNLENGISKNLWYEEIVPRETRFYFMTMFEGSPHYDFSNALVDHVIQIGGNATIGYGYTDFKTIEVVSAHNKKDGGRNE